jgi:hypothetical protein
MKDCAPVRSPMERGFYMSIREQTASQGAGKPIKGDRYPELIGSLLYLANTIRPDIAHAVGILARYRGCPTRSAHWNGAMRVIAYLKGTQELGVVFGSDNNVLHGFVDSDFGACIDLRKSTTGFVFMLHGGAVSWGSVKQRCTATSTVEAEYVAFAAATKEAIWLKKLMYDLSFERAPMVVNCDSQGCLANLRNDIASEYVKHIDIVYHMAREKVRLEAVFF